MNRLRAEDGAGGRLAIGELPGPGDLPAHEGVQESSKAGPRIALLTPYSGHNLGDAAIQDAIITNLRLRLPDAQFTGVCLNCDNYVDRHAANSFPLCGPGRHFYGMSSGKVTDQPGTGGSAQPQPANEETSRGNWLRPLLKKVTPLWWCLKRMRAAARRIGGELRHWVQAYRFIRTQDVLIVAGGGQLDEEWGGPWAHPFVLFKWAVLARMARVPLAFASVGACRVNSRLCRVFLSIALHMAKYRSYRDKHSRVIASRLWQKAGSDVIVPDMAFSLLPSELPAPAGIRSMAQGRQVVAISSLAYGKPGSCVYEDAPLHNRYLQQMARITSEFLRRDYFVVMVCSALGDDDHVIPEILERLDDQSKERAARQLHVPAIVTWQDLVALLQDVDLLVASRLHSTILGFMTKTPAVAISFDPKVDWVMEDLGQTEYLFQLRDFTAEDVINAIDRLESRRDSVMDRIGLYPKQVLPAFAVQYDALAKIARAGRRSGR